MSECSRPTLASPAMLNFTRCTPYLVALAIGCGLWSACTNESESDPFAGRRASDIDLLVRAPDSRAEHPGEITPRMVRDENGSAIQMDWGDFRGSGWRSFSPGLDWGAAGELAFIENNQPSASLLLPAPARADRELALSIWLAPGTPAESASVKVKLNGNWLAQLELTQRPQVHQLETHAELWREGQNQLELFATTRASEGELPSDWDTFRLARISYGEASSVDFDLRAARLKLEPGCGVTYCVESRSKGTLILRGQAAGPGRLRIESGEVTVLNGERELADVEQEFQLEGRFEKPVLLPRRSTGLGFIKLIWTPEGPATLDFEDLFIAEEAGSQRPPIIFVSIDTLSARHMSVYGYERKTTPALEAFAEQAVVFERCGANAPWTLPSYLSVMTGLYPTSHLTRVTAGAGKELSNNDYWQLALSRWTLAESLRARGYQTAAAVDTEWLAPTWRIDQGFDLYDTSAFGPFDNPELGIKLILKNYVTYLEEMRNPSAPCFTFIHALDAHGPFWAEAPYAGAFGESASQNPTLTPAGCMPQSYGAIPTWMAQTLAPAAERARIADWQIDPKLPLEDIIQSYDETILKVDDQLGKMFELLRAKGLYDESVIVISGDHGESFKHEFYSHGCMWEDILHVPLLIKLPNAEFGGKRISQSVQLVDIYPTLLELAGTNPEREYLHGRSLMPMIRGAKSAPRPTFSEGGHVVQFMLEIDHLKLIESFPGLNSADPALLTHPKIPEAWLQENFGALAKAGMLTKQVEAELKASAQFPEQVRELKQMLAGPFYELYDLANDPGELVNLYAQRPADAERLKALLQIEKNKGSEARQQASADIRIKQSAAEILALAALGYSSQESEEED